MAKSETFEPKLGRGVSLRPSLWARLESFAESQGKTRNQVIEQILNAHVPQAPDFRKSQENSSDDEGWLG